MIRATELTMHCPDIGTVLDADEVRQALAKSPGIDEVEINRQTGEVRVVTSNRDGGLDVRFRMAQAGFAPDAVEQRVLTRPPDTEPAVSSADPKR